MWASTGLGNISRCLFFSYVCCSGGGGEGSYVQDYVASLVS